MPADDRITLTREDQSMILRVYLRDDREHLPKKLGMSKRRVERLIDNPSLPLPPAVEQWFGRSYQGVA
jgi:hypothetical protein